MTRPLSEEEKRAAVQIRLPEELFERSKKAAEERSLSFNKFTVLAIEEFLDRLIPIEEFKWTREPNEH